MKRRGTPWRLPKFENIRFSASVSSSATKSRVNGWSLLPDRNVPLALYAFMARATRGDDLTSTARNCLVVGSRCHLVALPLKIEVG